MITQALHCPYCQGIDIVKNGKTSQGKQRFLCREQPCDGRTFRIGSISGGRRKKSEGSKVHAGS